MTKKQRVTGIFASAMATAAFLVGLTVVSPDTYHDIDTPLTTQSTTAGASLVQNDAGLSTDTYHDI
jgi:hypothetical protein